MAARGSKDIRIRFGLPNERAALEDIQRRASHALEEYRAGLLDYPESIHLPLGQLEERRVRVAEMESQPVGFSVLLPTNARTYELDGLFVEPSCWRMGVGRALLADAVDLARKQGASRIEVTANENAVIFYVKFGLVRLGSIQTQFGPAARMRYALTG
jgi:GNAT superfamily N-acetyltransferase